MSKYCCKYCNKCLSTKSNLNRHQITCNVREKIEREDHENLLKFKEKNELEKSNEEKLRQMEKSYEEKLRQMEKKIHSLELLLENKTATLKILDNLKPSIINNTYNNNNLSTNVNNNLNNNFKIILQSISNDLLKNSLKNISEDQIAKGPDEVYNHLVSTTDIKNKYYLSNKQLNTLTYRKPNVQKIIKDNNGIMLATDIVNNIPLKNFNIKDLEYKRQVNLISKNLLEGKSDEFIKQLGDLMCKYALSEYKLKDILSKEQVLCTKFKDKLLNGIIIYCSKYNKDDCSLCYGLNSVVYSLLKQNIVNIIDDDDNEINDLELFLKLLHECICKISEVFEVLFVDELNKAKAEDNVELVETFYKDFTEYIIDPSQLNIHFIDLINQYKLK